MCLPTVNAWVASNGNESFGRKMKLANFSLLTALLVRKIFFQILTGRLLFALFIVVNAVYL